MPKVAGNMFKILSNLSLYYTAKEKKGHRQEKKIDYSWINAHSTGTLMTEDLPQYPKFLFKEIIDWVE